MRADYAVVVFILFLYFTVLARIFFLPASLAVFYSVVLFFFAAACGLVPLLYAYMIGVYCFFLFHSMTHTRLHTLSYLRMEQSQHSLSKTKKRIEKYFRKGEKSNKVNKHNNYIENLIRIINIQYAQFPCW